MVFQRSALGRRAKNRARSAIGYDRNRKDSPGLSTPRAAATRAHPGRPKRRVRTAGSARRVQAAATAVSAMPAPSVVWSLGEFWPAERPRSCTSTRTTPMRSLSTRHLASPCVARCTCRCSPMPESSATSALHPSPPFVLTWAIGSCRPLADNGSPPAATRSDIRRADARAEKASFVELDRLPQISLLVGKEWAEGGADC